MRPTPAIAARASPPPGRAADAARPRRVPAVGAAAAAAALVWAGAALAIGTALVLEHGFGQAPCHLCRYERIPYYATLALLPAAAALGRLRLGLVLAGLLLLGDAALSAYHVAVEQGMVALPQSCASGADAPARSIAELRARLASAPPTCDRVSVGFLGLSLAAWNLAYAAALGALGLVAARLVR